MGSSKKKSASTKRAANKKSTKKKRWSQHVTQTSNALDKDELRALYHRGNAART